MVNGVFTKWLSSSTPKLDKLLKVPFDYQPEAEDECVIYCIWMALHYFKNKHPNVDLRKATESLSPDEIMEDMTIVEGGWKPNQDELTVVSERTNTLQFSLNAWQDGAPKSLFSMVKENIQNERPIIPFINGSRLREKTRENDGVHAVVASGYSLPQDGDEFVAIHDPWGYPEDIVERQKLEDAWDPWFNQVLTVSLSRRGSKIVGGNK
ncbi:C39 family peptidase [Halomarina pelagica]|uniref:C39 family peptidase n=1 Tax=Halomarina pelagica TaxID=2961599 RepID=UPI0020C248C2|nr:C39 family peptidase [Halomarina sp. BND7]